MSKVLRAIVRLGHWLEALDCRFGLHTGKWSELRAHCSQYRECSKCKTTDRRESHLWDGWRGGMFSPAERKCLRCGQTEVAEPSGM